MRAGGNISEQDFSLSRSHWLDGVAFPDQSWSLTRSLLQKYFNSHFTFHSYLNSLMLYKQWEYLKIHYIYIDRDRTNHQSAFLHVKSAKRNVENLSYYTHKIRERKREH